jgi:hypothetical protein
LNKLHPQLDLETRALAYYIQSHMQTLTEPTYVSGGLARCITEWRKSGRTDEMVDLALSCMALAVYGRTQSHPPAVADALSRYYCLLQVLQQHIGQIEDRKVGEYDVDACLLTIFIIARFEGVTHSPSDPEPRYTFKHIQNWSHRDGASAILNRWYDDPAHAAPTVIIQESRRGIIRASILRNHLLPDWIRDGEPFGEKDLELEYDRIFVRVLNLHYRFRSCKEKESLQASEIVEMSDEARDLDKALEAWVVHFPTGYAYQLHTLTDSGPWPRQHVYSSAAFTFSKLGHAALWNQYFTARMLLSSTHLRILGLSRPNSMCDKGYEHQARVCSYKLKKMSECMASAIPACLERIKAEPGESLEANISFTSDAEEIKPYVAHLVIWPLCIAASLEGVDSQIQKWFKSELAALGNIIGDGILSRADLDGYPML